MHLCLNCNARLLRLKTKKGYFWSCEKCGSRAIGVGILRKLVDPKVVSTIWTQAKTNETRPCPICHLTMDSVQIPELPPGFEVDRCRTCHSVWFDTGKFDSIPKEKVAPLARKRAAPCAARIAVAKLEMERIAEKAHGPDFSSQPTLEWWQMVLVILGMPVENNPTSRSNLPWGTWLLLIATSLFSILAFSNFEMSLQQFAFLPTDPFRRLGITMFSCFFLHGDWFHLIGNMYFLLVFGDDVEDYLGHILYFSLILISTVGGSLAVSYFAPNDLPNIGASGGVFGIVIFYMLTFPRSRLVFFIFLRFVQVPAWAALVMFAFFQGLGSVQQLQGVTSISYVAHLGGGAIGFIFWLIFRKRS